MTQGNVKNKDEYQIKFKLSFYGKCQVFPFNGHPQTDKGRYITRSPHSLKIYLFRIKVLMINMFILKQAFLMQK